MKKYDIKRSAKRVRVEVPVHLDQGTGVSLDVSRSGVFFLTDQPFSPGTIFSFVLELDYIFPGETIMLHCRGEVVRVKEADEKRGVAAIISEFGTEGVRQSAIAGGDRRENGRQAAQVVTGGWESSFNNRYYERR
jgi:hypothetical protein